MRSRPNSSKARQSALLLWVVAFAMAAAGCGGDGGEQGTSTIATSAQPHRGGEASIEDFGTEAAGSERAAILASFQGYLNSVGAEDYATACGYLAASVKSGLRQFSAAPLKAKGCAAILPKLLAPTVAAMAREQANGEVRRVRAQGNRGFVVFRAPGAKLYQQTMAREGGRWKVTTVAAPVLVPNLGFER